MKLLDAKSIKESKKQSEVDRQELVRKLREEERVSVQRLNDALEVEEKEKKRIAEDLTFARDEGVAAVKKSILLQEIKILEERKSEALEPIHEIQQQAEKILDSAKASFTDSKRRSSIVSENEQDLSERVEAFADREAESLEKIQLLNKREERIKAAEEELKRSISELSKKWADYHKVIHTTNTELSKREWQVKADKKANEEYNTTLRKFEQELQGLERDYKDRLETLQRHIQFLEKEYGRIVI